MSAPALPRTNLDALTAASHAADAAYTQAVQDAAQTKDWNAVQIAAHAFKQARSALRAAEGITS